MTKFEVIKNIPGIREFSSLVFALAMQLEIKEDFTHIAFSIQVMNFPGASR